MKYTKKTAKIFINAYGVDLSTIHTVTGLLDTMEDYTYEVTMDAAFGEPEIHGLETVNGAYITFITSETSPDEIVEIYFE